MNIPSDFDDDFLFEKIKGDRIGGGTSREVYGVIGHNDKVLKVLQDPGASDKSSNHVEHHIYRNTNNKAKCCLAEVIAISKSGIYLIMEKLAPLDDMDSLINVQKPIEITDVFDRKNFGKTLNGTIKIVDYGQVKSCTLSGNTVSVVGSAAVKAMDKILKNLPNY